MVTLKEKFDNFEATTNIEEFKEYYYTHNDPDVLNEYNLTNGLFKYIKTEYKLNKSREQIKAIRKRTWEDKPTSLKNKHSDLLGKFSKEDIEDYYIKQNNSFEDSIKHFNLIPDDFLFLLQHYDLKKDKKLSKVLADNTKEHKYGDKNYNNREKSKQTCLEKYGVDNPFKDVEKIQNSIENKYGVKHPCQNKDIMDKFKNTMQEKYGGIGYGSDVIMNKIQKTTIEKYGYDNAAKSPVIKEKIKKSLENTFMNMCGSNCYFTSPNRKFSYHTVNSSYNLKFIDVLNDNDLTFEQEFTLSRYSYDFKVGDNLIEINPSATHNSTWSPFGDKSIKKKDYHYNKTLFAKENGYRCINVWDWDDVNKIIFLLKDRKRVYARQCGIKEVAKKEGKEFINTYHIQNYANATVNLGLFYNNELVSIMTFGKPRYNKNYEYELIRYCSSYFVVGGAEKLFKYFLEKYNPSSIISYCDNSKFDGNVYSSLGFTLKTYGAPSKHWYNIGTGKHITDNLLRQRGFDQLLGKEYGCYGKGTSNELLMLENGFVEVFDCGQSVYTYKIV